MKKVMLSLLLVLALSTSAFAALTLDLAYSNTTGSGTYGALQLTDITGGVQVSANFNPAVFTPTVGSFGVQDVYLNLLANSYTGSLSFTQLGTQNNGGTSSWELDYGAQADGLGTFTLAATSDTNAAGLRIPIVPSPGFTPLFTLTAAGLEVSDFLAFSQEHHEATPWIAAMHLAGYTRCGSTETSSYLAATPIPGTVYLFGSGLGGLIGIARWRRRK